MNCRNIHKKLIFFLEGELSEPEAQKVAQHLTECSDCAAFAREMEKSLHVIIKERSPEVNPFFFTRIKARMEKETEIQRSPYLVLIWNRVLQPIVFSLILLSGIYVGIRIGQPTTYQFENPVYANTELIPFLNEMDAEPIESFLME